MRKNISIDPIPRLFLPINIYAWTISVFSNPGKSVCCDVKNVCWNEDEQQSGFFYTQFSPHYLTTFLRCSALDEWTAKIAKSN
jgi:hypothetical protein